MVPRLEEALKHPTRKELPSIFNTVFKIETGDGAYVYKLPGVQNQNRSARALQHVNRAVTPFIIPENHFLSLHVRSADFSERARNEARLMQEYGRRGIPAVPILRLRPDHIVLPYIELPTVQEAILGQNRAAISAYAKTFHRIRDAALQERDPSLFHPDMSPRNAFYDERKEEAPVFDAGRVFRPELDVDAMDAQLNIVAVRRFAGMLPTRERKEAAYRFLSTFDEQSLSQMQAALHEEPIRARAYIGIGDLARKAALSITPGAHRCAFLSRAELASQIKELIGRQNPAATTVSRYHSALKTERAGMSR